MVWEKNGVRFMLSMSLNGETVSKTGETKNTHKKSHKTLKAVAPWLKVSAATNPLINSTE